MSTGGMTIRPATAADTAFVADTWYESFFSRHAAGPWTKKALEAAANQTLPQILGQPDMVALVAVNDAEDDPALSLMGHVIVAHGAHSHRRGQRCIAPVLHYVFVKVCYRGHGVAGRLLSAAGITPRSPLCYTFKTPPWSAIQLRHYPAARWDPLVVRFLPPVPAATRA